MARTYSFSPASKSAPANSTTTVVWSPAEIDAAGVVAFHLILQQTAGTLDLNDVARIRVKANGQTVVDCTVPQLQAFQERFSPKGVSDALAGRVLTIPLCKLGAPGGEADEDRCQFMPGAAATVEVTFTTDATGAGIAFLAWTKTTVEPQFYSTLIAQPMNVGASQTNARVPLGAPGYVEAIGLVPTNIAQVRGILGGLEVFNLAGAVYNGLTNLGDMLQAVQALYDGPDDASQVVTFQFLRCDQGLEANPSTSWLEVTSGAGMTAAIEAAVYAVVPVTQGA